MKIFKTNKLLNILFTVAATSLFSGSLLAATTELLPLKKGDVASEKIEREEEAVNMFRAATDQYKDEYIFFTWPIESNKELNLKSEIKAEKSKSYRLRVKASEFKKGIKVPTVAPEALVRVNPVFNSVAAFSARSLRIARPLELTIKNEAGQFFQAKQAMRSMISDEQSFAAAEAPFGEDTSVFQLNKELGAGSFTIASETVDEYSNDEYIINVLEKNSKLSLSAKPEKDVYLDGETLSVQINLEDEEEVAPSARAFSTEKRRIKRKRFKATAVVISPSGQTYPARYNARTGKVKFKFRKIAEKTPGLWEVQVTSKGKKRGKEYIRTVRTSFAHHAPTAKLEGWVDITDSSQKLSAEIGLDIGVAGRYEVRGILYGTDRNGKLKPIAITHAADQFSTGNWSIELPFDKKLIRQSGLKAPFEVKDLNLIHQDRMSLLHRQQDGFKIQ